jgi:AraC-like DNA-binding protein
MPLAGPWTPDGLPDVVLMTGPAQRYRGNIHSELKLVVSSAPFDLERRGVRYRAAADQLIALHPNEAHSGRPAEAVPGQWRVMCLPSSLVFTVAGPASLRFEPPVLADAGLARRFRAVFGLFEQPVPTRERREALLELAAALIPHADRGEWTEPGRGPAGMREFLQRHVFRNVTLDELADVTGIDKFRLVRACTACYGLAPHTLHLRLRLDRARDLIRDGRALAEIAYETGFYDQAHFARTFARAYGETPSQYRAAWHGTGPSRKLTG